MSICSSGHRGLQREGVMAVSAPLPPSIVILGNCQGAQLAACLRRMLPQTTVHFARYFGDADIATLVNGDDQCLVLVQNPVMSFGDVVGTLRETCRVIDFPAIAHAGFHPDLIRPKQNRVLVQGPLGSNHSALVLYAYLRGMDETATQALFRSDVFQALGYYEARAESDGHLCATLTQFGLYDELVFTPILGGSSFMHNTIHPKLPLIAALARAILARAGIPPVISYPENLMADDLANNVVWPIYPEIGEALGIAGGEYVFQFKPSPKHTFDLPDFIARSFAAYREQSVDASCHARLSSPAMEQLDRLIQRSQERPASSNPYRAYPDHQFWRRAVVAPGHGGIDPVANPPVVLDATTRIGTAGSCFAQHIARRLAATGHNYVVTEPGDGLAQIDRERRNFGVYSARYGNIYTARQMRQLIERANGSFVPTHSAWQREDGRFIDPFRPEIEPDGFASPADVEAARQEHFSAVRTLLREVDVFVFTLGLTEGWYSPSDGAVYPLCPMAVSPQVDPAEFRPINFTQGQVLEDLLQIRALLAEINPDARILLTVSPVPLVATFEPRHVLVSTAASKAILRSAADEACQLDPAFAYFPSFEIVANPYFAESYFDPADARSVLSHGVDHVMRVFLQHCSSIGGQALHTAALPPSASALARELDEERHVVCEEERLDP